VPASEGPVSDDLQVEGAALARLGWDEALAAAAAADVAHLGASPGRVARVDRGWATVMTATGTVRAQLAGHSVATGDWLLLEHGKVVAALRRRSAFVRGDAGEGRSRRPQVVAANVDLVFVVQSLNNGPNIRRLERELVLAFESGAVPVVVLSKADLVDPSDVELAVEAARAAAADVEVVVTSAVTGTGLDRLRSLAHADRTVALIGASGVGKSRLVNGLVGDSVQAIGAVRENDQRGRHTTTARELVALPGGGWLVDTPGLRSVAMWDADDGLSRVFADIEELVARCRFKNCSHGPEPDCAVRAAIERGELDAARFAHYQQLDEELDENARER
jgi:ribosome biogenesis GTPase / thiamine phosphate phosphatase